MKQRLATTVQTGVNRTVDPRVVKTEFKHINK